MDKYILDTVCKQEYSALSKSRSDIYDVLAQEGFKKISIVLGTNKKRLLHETHSIRMQLSDNLSKVAEDSVVVMQYPWPTMSYSFSLILKRLKKKKKIKTICYVHDLNSIRTNSILTKIYYDLYVKELRFLKDFDIVICHNDKMKEYLEKCGIESHTLVSLEIFDYLIAEDMMKCKDSCDYKTVSVAGNLLPEKAGYIYRFSELNNRDYNICLYGSGWKGNTFDNVCYKGTFPPEKLPVYIYYGFGLIWDGPSVLTCEGNFGEYLKLNNPHKMSLYMACGVPVFVWNQSAISQFVEQEQVGICISSLTEIDELMRNMSTEEYTVLKENAMHIQKKVRSGYYTSISISKALKILEEK